MPFKRIGERTGDIWLPDGPTGELGTLFSAGDWNINPGGSRFVAPRRPELDLATKARYMRQAGVTHIEFHSTEAPAKDAKEIRRVVEGEGLKVHMVTANLFRLDRYTNGNLGDALADTRRSAIEDTKAYIAAGIESFGANVYVYWNSSNGTTQRLGVNYRDLYLWTAESIARIVEWMLDTYGPEKALAFCIEPKPNEPRVWSLPANVGEALAIIALLPEKLRPFVGVNPEVCHSHMAGLNYAAELGLADASGKLFHVHLNGGPEYPMWDADLAFGDHNFNVAVETVLTLREVGFQGVVGLDVQPLATDREDQQAESLARSIRNFKRALECADCIDRQELEQARMIGNQARVAEIVTATICGN